jgi:pimeloyl-ACP methyl ester carboxylesterase
MMPTQNQLPLPGEVFEVDGKSAFLIAPDPPAQPPREWVFYAPTIGKHPDKTEKWMFERFVARGVAIAGIDIGESSGNPAGRHTFSSLYEELVQRRGFAPRARLLARSRGGLMLYNWAADHPDRVARVAGIYPVCDLRSYPGLERACGAYGMSAEALKRDLTNHNPVDRLKPLAQAHIPIFHIHGDNDTVVPLEANSLELKNRFDALGGKMTLHVVEGGGHDVRRVWFECDELVDFLTAETPSTEVAR